MNKFLALISLVVLTLPAISSAETVMQVPAKASNNKTSFPINYISLIQNQQLEDSVKQIEFFSQIDEKNNGSPVSLIITFTDKATSGGQAAGFTSALLSGSTLGILPVVTNKDITVRYEVILHRRSFTSFEYTENFTDAQNLYSAGQQQISDEALAWIMTTVDKLKEEVEASPELAQLLYEYNYYYQ